MSKFNNLDQPIAILIRGLPGSGKSYLAAALQKAIGDEAVVLLDPDTINFTSDTYHKHCKTQAAEGVDEKLFPYRFLRNQAYRGIRNHKIIIWNQPFTDLDIFDKMIDRLRTNALENTSELELLIVELNIDTSLAHQRTTKRKQAGGHGPSDTTFDRFVNTYQSASTHGYTSNIISVQGDSDVNKSVDLILERVSAIITA